FSLRRSIPLASGALLVLSLALVTACSSSGRLSVPPGTSQPDKFLFDKGNEALQKKKWITAREFFKQVTETYTQSPLRPDAKLAVGDTYLGEGTTEAYILAIAEFQEFLSYYPTHPRADYAQYQLGLAHFRQMRAPQRDQTETRDTIREFEAFVVRYPKSALLPEAKNRLREAHDRLSASEFEVGQFYYHIHWYPGAIDRLSTLLKNDPDYTQRDGAYFYLAESYYKANRMKEALPYYERLLDEFKQSQFMAQTKKRVAELKSGTAGQPAAAATAPKTQQ
ncbi:MAG: outer membrane protein assembly factor BamD, partial [Acidobacteriaceae bacterium]|nr:outer membrane protein assembly factor BamD [Acidobacteriaceae bacterium]